MTDNHPTDSASSSDTPDHLRTSIPSGGLTHEAAATHAVHHNAHDGSAEGHHVTGASEKEKGPAPPEDEDEDIDALIAELESEDGDDEDEEEAAPGMSARPIPEELLNTDTRKGLTSQEVTERRRKYGLNQMAEEKENLIKKFLGYFVGPIQFVMEVNSLIM
jgi:H+-transporting ATPase